MPGRWSGSPEPVPSIVVLGESHGQVWDIGRLTAPQRMDIPVGTSEPVDVAGKFDNDQSATAGTMKHISPTRIGETRTGDCLMDDISSALW